MDTNYSDNNSRAKGTENNKDKKTKDIDNVDKKKLSGIFFCPDKRAFTTK